jgi:hypothetical protein
MKHFSDRRGTAVFLFAFFLLTSNYVFAQETDSKDTEEKSSWDLFLVPILETVFKGELQWRPDWPSDIPFDGFSISNGDTFAQVVELSNEKESYVLKRNDEGHLTDFPFFLTDKYINVKVEYDAAGALLKMNIELKKYASAEDDGEEKTDGQSKEQSGKQSGKQSDDQSEGTSMDIVFPKDFLPYSELSLGGAFPVITVTADGTQYYVYLFESPLFLTETWYDGEGNLLAYSRANTYVKNGAWLVKSLQIHNADDIQFIDYFYDSSGNITEIRSSDNVFSALYNGKRPVSWNLVDSYSEMHWDTQGLLTYVRVYDPEGKQLINEYRYEYQNDDLGNWIKRPETAYIFQYGLLAANPPSGRGTWSRRIVYFTGGDDGR